MKQILSLALLLSALSVNHAHAMAQILDIELAEGVTSWNELNVSVELEDLKDHSSDLTNNQKYITRSYTLQGDRLHAAPSYNKDVTTVSVGSGYAANVELCRLEQNKQVALCYSVYGLPPLGDLPWPLSLISSATPVKSSGIIRIPLNTPFEDRIIKPGTDIELMLKIKAVLRTRKMSPPPCCQKGTTNNNNDTDNDDDNA